MSAALLTRGAVIAVLCLSDFRGQADCWGGWAQCTQHQIAYLRVLLSVELGNTVFRGVKSLVLKGRTAVSPWLEIRIGRGVLLSDLEREGNGRAGSCAAALALHRGSNGAEGQHIDGILG